MNIDRPLVTRVAELANLKLSDSELAYYETQLGKILGFVEQLNQLDDKLGKNWRSDTLGDPTPERADTVAPSLSVELAMSQAPQASGTVFQVPRILE